MQKDYPKVEGIYDQIRKKPRYAELTAEGVIRGLYQVFLKREPTDEELQQQLVKIKTYSKD